MYDWAYFPVRPLRAGRGGVGARRAHPTATPSAGTRWPTTWSTPPWAPRWRRSSAQPQLHEAIEDTFKQAKGLVGLDHYEVAKCVCPLPLTVGLC